MNKPHKHQDAAFWEPSPNNLEPFWMGFTPNRAFKKRPRLLARSEGMHYYDMSGRAVLDATALAAAQEAVNNFAAHVQSPAATAVPEPSGGWDRAAPPPQDKPRASVPLSLSAVASGKQ